MQLRNNHNNHYEPGSGCYKRYFRTGAPVPANSVRRAFELRSHFLVVTVHEEGVERVGHDQHVAAGFDGVGH